MNTATITLPALTGYRIMDTHTGATLATYTPEKKLSARRKAEKLNLAYGAHRYSVVATIAALDTY